MTVKRPGSAAVLIGMGVLVLTLFASCNRQQGGQIQTNASQTASKNTPTETPGKPSEEFVAPKYRVEPVLAPPLQRPPVSPSREKLPKGATGSLPSFDGDPFHINLNASGDEQASEEKTRQVMIEVLRALTWDRNPEELKLASRTKSSGAKPEIVDLEARKGLEETKKRLIGKLGPLSKSTEKTLEERMNENKANATRSQENFLFDQRFEDVRIENSGVQGVWQQGRGLTAVIGRVFNKVEVTNKKVLDEAKAVGAVNEYLGRYTKVMREQNTKPELVILPYGEVMLYAWRVDVNAEEGPYRFWIDAENGRVLQLEPQFFADSATGLTFDISPGTGTREQSFEVNGPAGGNYVLTLTGRVVESNNGGDGVTNSALTIAGGGGSANFNVAPINSATVERTGNAGYNSRFQEVNAYAWVYSDMKWMEAFGSQPFVSLNVMVNHGNPCGFGLNNACAGGTTLQYGIGAATTSNSTTASDVFNSALDATVVTHEFGHILDARQVNVSGGTMTGAINEGLSDFWAATIHNNTIFGPWWGHNRAAPVQNGFAPRQADALDVFPDHRVFAAEAHADGQMINWALWNTRTGLNSEGALGTLLIDVELLKALTTYGVGITNGNSDKQVHDSYLNLLQQLATQFGTSSDINKLTSGFARAGIFLSERDAVIDIDDDYLARGAPSGPTFTIWTGRDYQFNGTTAQAANVFNTQFEVEVANDAAFTVNHVTSGSLGGVTNPAGGVPSATWTLPVGNWNTLKAGDRLYYRVTTNDGTGGNSRVSTSPGNGFIASVGSPSAVINESGACECSCNPAMALPNITSRIAWMVLLPPLIALFWRRRLRQRQQ